MAQPITPPVTRTVRIKLRSEENPREYEAMFWSFEGGIVKVVVVGDDERRVIVWPAEVIEEYDVPVLEGQTDQQQQDQQQDQQQPEGDWFQV